MRRAAVGYNGDIQGVGDSSRRGACMRSVGHTISIAAIVVTVSLLAFNSEANGETHRFVEFFDGEGPFQGEHPEAPKGLHNPGWEFQSDTDAFFSDDGLVFNDGPERPRTRDNQDVISRDVVGDGSFRHFVEVTDVELNTDSSAMTASQVTLEHYLVFERGQIDLVQVSAWSLAQENLFAIGVGLHGDLHLFDESKFPEIRRGNNISLAIEFDQQTRQIVFEYDSDVQDEANAIQQWEFAYEGSVSAMQRTRLAFWGGSNPVSAADGTLVYWSLTDLDRDLQFADFDSDGSLTVSDVEQLAEAIRGGEFDMRFDVDFNNRLNRSDLDEFVREYAKTFYGDANLDGRFDSVDLVFKFAEYQDRIPGNSTWRSGDWNLDGDFDSSDLVLAFKDAGYESTSEIYAVPEPTGLALCCCAATLVTSVRGRRRQTRYPTPFRQCANLRERHSTALSIRHSKFAYYRSWASSNPVSSSDSITPSRKRMTRLVLAATSSS
ncbi:MAG: hypothetical protein KDB27_07620 [Planctomycetales bacterium]|nr:hypothetical protein [Planctomycetales bacterium]